MPNPNIVTKYFSFLDYTCDFTFSEYDNFVVPELITHFTEQNVEYPLTTDSNLRFFPQKHRGLFGNSCEAPNIFLIDFCNLCA